METSFKVGDLVRVTIKNPEDNKVSSAPFEGIVISLRGKESGTTFTVRKIASDKVAVERIYPLNSPAIESVKVVKSATKVRRAKLYYLRNR